MPLFFSYDGDLSRYDDVFLTRIQATDFSGQGRGSHKLRDYEVAQEELRNLVASHIPEHIALGGVPDTTSLFDLTCSDTPTKDWNIFVRSGV